MSWSIVVASLAVVAAACGGVTAKGPSVSLLPTPSSTTSSETGSPTSTAATPTSADVLYFTRGHLLGAARRTVEAGSEDPRHAALEVLLAGPDQAETADGLGSDIPTGTDLRGLSVSDGVATVNFGPSFSAPAPQASQLARVAQVVFTLTEFSGVSSVTFTIAGAPLGSFGGISLANPVGRSQLAGALPPLALESPISGDSVGRTLEIKGTATYSGTFRFQLLSSSGTVIVDSLHTAVAGGTFDDTVPVPRGQSGIATARIAALTSSGDVTSEIQLLLPIST